ncbi:MAG: phosphoribosylglycinamide formyltransferase [Candidatus Sumerlaeia bacterium]|nr:phosphoribosylglycinamide formyltransferase [Candidatus Sumerlaeia bacterium]
MKLLLPEIPLKVAVFVSGRGSNLAALLDARDQGKLPYANLCVVVSNQPDAPALEIARRHGIETIAVDHRPFGRDRAAHEAAILDMLAPHGIDLVVLAGYMRILTPTLLRAFAGRMINIHPSLLPAFPGVDAQGQAHRYGVKVSGCTVHFVNEETDGGPVILQRAVPIPSGANRDLVAGKILAEEHKALPLTVDLFTRGRIRAANRHVAILHGDGSFPELEESLPLHQPVIAATGNEHKVWEMGAILADTPVWLLQGSEVCDLTEPEENAPDYLGNARIKAHAWYRGTRTWCLADDSGLEVDALDGRPGVHSSRYASTNEKRLERLLTELDGVPMEKRTARFACTVVLAGPDGAEYHSTGTCEGRIATEVRGEGGFGYDPLFIPDGFGGRHLAELSAEEKNAISHRGRALQGLKGVLRELFGKELN